MALLNAQVFSYLVAYGEVLVGLALVIGVVTNFAALMGIVMNLSLPRSKIWADTTRVSDARGRVCQNELDGKSIKLAFCQISQIKS